MSSFQTVRNVRQLTQRLQPIADDVRIFTDKIAHATPANSVCEVHFKAADRCRDEVISRSHLIASALPAENEWDRRGRGRVTDVEPAKSGKIAAAGCREGL